VAVLSLVLLLPLDLVIAEWVLYLNLISRHVVYPAERHLTGHGRVDSANSGRSNGPSFLQNHNNFFKV